MGEVCIREFRFSGDYSAVARLWAHAGAGIHVGPSDAPDQLLKKLQRDPDLFLVAEAGGQIIGTVVGGFDGRRGAIYHLAVQSAFRGQGVGEQLMGGIKRSALEKNLDIQVAKLEPQSVDFQVAASRNTYLPVFNSTLGVGQGILAMAMLAQLSNLSIPRKFEIFSVVTGLLLVAIGHVAWHREQTTSDRSDVATVGLERPPDLVQGLLDLLFHRRLLSDRIGSRGTIPGRR